jgi:hypothetical protein
VHENNSGQVSSEMPRVEFSRLQNNRSQGGDVRKGQSGGKSIATGRHEINFSTGQIVR